MEEKFWAITFWIFTDIGSKSRFKPWTFLSTTLTAEAQRSKNCENISLEQADLILSSFPFHGFFWKKFPPWNTEKFPEISEKATEEFRSNLLKKIQNILEKFSTPSIRDESYESILSDFQKGIVEWEDLGYLVRKTEIYILRHRNTLDETRKKNLFLGAVLKEFTGLKRKLLAGGSVS